MNKKFSLFIAFISLAAFSFFGYFCFRFFVGFDFTKIEAATLIRISIAVISVYFLKFLRLYIILLGNSFTKKTLLRNFFGTSIVTSILPFKTGEFYKGFAIGKMIGSYPGGFIAVFYDRFIDTIALITVSLVAGLFTKIEITNAFLILLLFLIFMIFIYCLFDSFYRYWNQFLILRKSSKNTLRALQLLNICHKAVTNIKTVVMGRFPILYLISLSAWILEFSFVVLLSPENNLNRYISNLFTGNISSDNTLYILISILLYLIFELFLFAGFVFKKILNSKKDK